MKAIISTTNGVILEGTTDYIGSATMCISVPSITADKANRLYTIDATMRQYSDHWDVQISKKHIEDVKLFDEE